MNLDSNLSWVLENEQLHNVSEYANLKPQFRPIVYCPVCQRQVTLKLGKKNIFHAAHKQDGLCSVTQPETAIHLNAKLHVARELRKLIPVSINFPCMGLNDKECCHKTTDTRNYLLVWNEVFVEYAIDQFRPDIVLLKDGKTVGAVEIYVTHAIEPEKEFHLQALSIPWIEVEANKVLPKDERDKGWQASEPLVYRKINTTVTSEFLCQPCRNDNERIKQETNQKMVALQWTTTAFRMVDIYYPKSGKRYRAVCYARKRVINGIVVELRIENDGKVLASITNLTDIQSDRHTLGDAFELQLMEYQRQGKVDSHMTWHKWYEAIYGQLLEKSYYAPFPPKFYWSKKSKDWLPDKYSEIIDWNKNFDANDNWSKDYTLRNLLDKEENLSNNPPKVFKQRDTPLPISENNKEAECIFCHKITSDWWWYDRTNNTCRCHDCYRAGITEPSK